jgi:hypothetical protein
VGLFFCFFFETHCHKTVKLFYPRDEFRTQVNRLQLSSRFTLLGHNWPVLAAAILGILLTVASYLAFQWEQQRRIAGHAHYDASVYSRMLREGAQSYVHLNRNVAELFSVSMDVTPCEFASCIHEPGIMADELIRLADQAMYLAKQAGGNQFKTMHDHATTS